MSTKVWINRCSAFLPLSSWWVLLVLFLLLLFYFFLLGLLNLFPFEFTNSFLLGIYVVVICSNRKWTIHLMRTTIEKSRTYGSRDVKTREAKNKVKRINKIKYHFEFSFKMFMLPWDKNENCCLWHYRSRKDIISWAYKYLITVLALGTKNLLTLSRWANSLTNWKLNV